MKMIKSKWLLNSNTFWLCQHWVNYVPFQFYSHLGHLLFSEHSVYKERLDSFVQTFFFVFLKIYYPLCVSDTLHYISELWSFQASNEKQLVRTTIFFWNGRYGLGLEKKVQCPKSKQSFFQKT